MRAAGHVQAEKLRVWNSYFDRHGVDVIMAPGQLCDAISYAGMAEFSLPLQVRQVDGSYREEDANIVQCNLIAYMAFKDIPVPKVGAATRSTACGCRFAHRGRIA